MKYSFNQSIYFSPLTSCQHTSCALSVFTCSVRNALTSSGATPNVNKVADEGSESLLSKPGFFSLYETWTYYPWDKILVPAGYTRTCLAGVTTASCQLSRPRLCQLVLKVIESYYCPENTPKSKQNKKKIICLDETAACEVCLISNWPKQLRTEDEIFKGRVLVYKHEGGKN